MRLEYISAMQGFSMISSGKVLPLRVAKCVRQMTLKQHKFICL